MQQAYAELEIGADSTPDMIKSQYRKLVLELHPDRNSGRNESRLKNITEAYHTLKNEARHRTSTRAPSHKNTRRYNPGRGTKHSRPNAPEEDWSRFTAEFEGGEFWKEYERNFWKEYEQRMAPPRDPKPEQGRTWHTPGTHTDPEPRTRAVPRYQVRIEKSLCIGCCSCETIAPNAFRVNKDTKVNPKSSVIDPLGAKSDLLIDAAQTCPTKAIIIDDVVTARRVYPL